ncbi:hypothetical protein B0H11DRAFT_2184320 [Mycena galericulata]|nr:hypothetical protein B0H11DRAFT_2184320 [Mycena galericulata]
MLNQEHSSPAKHGMQNPSSEVIEIDSDSDDAGDARKGPEWHQINQTKSISSEIHPVNGSSEDVEDPTRFETIKGDLEKLLNSGLNFEGVFACFEQYSTNSAPNPFLRIDELGAIGIPINGREAIAIMSSCLPRPLEHSLEIPSLQVRFDNPEWDVWIQQKAGPAAFKVLAGRAAVAPSYTFKRMVLQEPGSQLTCFEEPNSESEKSKDKIGTLVVVLPSEFTGGRIQLRHRHETLLADLSHASGLSTSVIAAYSGVASELAPLLSGYRLSLAYDIVQSPTRLSGLPDMQITNQKLRQLLTSWLEATAYSRIFHCLLKGKYEKGPSFGMESLTGSDKHMMTSLVPLAGELGFHLHFAHVQLVISASDTIEEIYHYDGYGENPYDDLGEDDFNFNMEDEDGELSILQVVDLGGMPLAAPGVSFLATDLINGSITDGEPDLSDFDKEDDTTANLTNTYRRTVLLISKSDMGYTPDISEIFDYASSTLRESVSLAPGAREMILVDSLLQLAETSCDIEQLSAVSHLLSEAADRWNNLPILLKTLKACRVDEKINVLGVEHVISMYQAFGWEALKEFFTDAMKNDETNVARQALLTGLLEMSREEGSHEVIAWCENQQEEILRNLRILEVNQIGWLVGLATTRGGEFLIDVIFPQLQAQKLGTTVWIALMRSLQSIPAWPGELVHAVILFCVTQAVEMLSAFPKTADGQVDIDPITEVIRVCLETENMQLCHRISARMRDVARTESFYPRLSPWIYYSKLAVSLDAYLQANHPGDTPLYLKPFFSDAVDAMLSAGLRTKHECFMEPSKLAIMNTAIKRAGGLPFLKERSTADYWKARTSTDLQAFARSVRAEFSPSSGDAVAVSEFQEVTYMLVNTAIQAFDMASLIPRKPTVSYSEVIRHILELIRFCFQVDAVSKCQDFLLKLLEPPAGFTIYQHVDKVLVPLIPVLKTFLATVQLDYQSDPFRTFCVAVVKAYANTVVGLNPHQLVAAAELEGVGCNSCSECAALRVFFVEDARTIDFSRVQAKRSHLEHQLSATSAWGVTWDTHKLGSPHTLRVRFLNLASLPRSRNPRSQNQQA